MANISCRIWPTWSFEMPTVSSISRTFNWRSANMLKLVKPIFDGRHRRRRVTVHSIQGLFDFSARFPFQKQELNHQLILLFFHVSKIRGHACFHARSKQNYESDSAEIFTVAIYENVLHDSKSLAIVAPLGGEAKYLSDCPQINRDFQNYNKHDK